VVDAQLAAGPTGGLGAEAEQVGEHRRGDAVRQRAQRAGPRAHDRDAEVAQVARQMRRVHRLSGLLAGEQPAVVGGVGAPQNRRGGLAQLGGQRDGAAAEQDPRADVADA
jgi:hypothetical protein